MQMFSAASTPEKLLTALLLELNLKSDTDLFAALGLHQSGVSLLRNNKRLLSCNVIMRIWAVTGWHISDILTLAGVNVITKPFKGELK